MMLAHRLMMGGISLLTLTPQGTANGYVANAKSVSITTPSFAAGDIAIWHCFAYHGGVISDPNIVMALPTSGGWTQIGATRTALKTVAIKGGSNYYDYALISAYKVLTAGDTTIVNSCTAVYNPLMASTVVIYRPSTDITTVAVQDNASTVSNTINASASSVSTIAFASSGGLTTGTPTHTWGTTPDYEVSPTRIRSGAYAQGSSPSDVTWSSSENQSSPSATLFESGYLEIS